MSCSAGPIENTDADVSTFLSRDFLGRLGVFSLSSYTNNLLKEGNFLFGNHLFLLMEVLRLIINTVKIKKIIG